MVYTLAASLRFVLVSQSVGEHRRSSKKTGPSPKASLAAEALVNVTHNHRTTVTSGMGKKRCGKKDKMRETEKLCQTLAEKKKIDTE